MRIGFLAVYSVLVGINVPVPALAQELTTEIGYTQNADLFTDEVRDTLVIMERVPVSPRMVVLQCGASGGQPYTCVLALNVSALSTGSAVGLIRVDQNQVREYRLQANNNRFISQIEGAEAIELAREWANGSALHVRVTSDYSSNQASFSLLGSMQHANDMAIAVEEHAPPQGTPQTEPMAQLLAAEEHFLAIKARWEEAPVSSARWDALMRQLLEAAEEYNDLRQAAGLEPYNADAHNLVNSEDKF